MLLDIILTSLAHSGGLFYIKKLMRYPMPAYATAGAAMGCPDFDGIKYIQHHPKHILTSASFAPTPRKSLLDRLVEFLRQEGRP